MRCSDVHERMSEALDRRLPAGEARSFRAHVGTCPACAQEWERWQRIDALFRGAPLAEAPRDLTAQILARLRPRVPWLPLSASVLALAVGLNVLAALFLLPALAAVCSTALAVAGRPGVVEVLFGVVDHVWRLATIVWEAGWLLLWGVAHSRLGAVALCYTLVALVAVAGWLRVAVFARGRQAW